MSDPIIEKTRLDLFHAFVIEQFGDNEISSSDISSRMKKLIGVILAHYFGRKLTKIVDTDEFKAMFDVTKGENGMTRIKAKLPAKESYAGDELLEQMKSVSSRKAKLRYGAQRMGGLANEIKLKFGEDQYFFGTYISNYEGPQGFVVPAVQVSFIEKIGIQGGECGASCQTIF